MFSPNKPHPVFIYGALRSGTTLLRLVLDHHPGVANPGEADFLFDHIHPDPTHPSGWRYDIAALSRDRIFRNAGLFMPPHCDGQDLLAHFLADYADRAPGILTLNVHRNAEKLMQLVPHARLVHLLRDPRDVARSVIAMGWAGTYLHACMLWEQTERAWDRAILQVPDSRVHDVRYEDLVEDPAGTLTGLCQFLSLPYAPNMLRFHQHSTYRPIDPTLAGQWRRRAMPAQLQQVEGEIGTLMQSRGYGLTGPVRPVGRAFRLVLGLRNKLAIWRFGMRRYGTGLYWSEKVLRRIGWQQAQVGLKDRIDVITAQHLK